METKVTVVIRTIEEQLRTALHDKSLCEQYAWWTLCAITGTSKIMLLTQDVLTLSSDQQARLADWLDKMIHENMPIQYLLGSVPFCDLDILVQPPILIPRPETEEWVANLIPHLKRLSHTALQILDICSGSGCIALALAKALPNARIIAADINPAAVTLGRRNAAHNGITNVTFVHSDLFGALNTDQLFDLIVANPPYISFDEFSELDASVSTWEDTQALVADDQGRAIIDAIIETAPDYLTNASEMAQHNLPQLMLEIGYTQGPAVAEFFTTCGYTNVVIHKDLEGKDRVVSGRISNAKTPFMAE